MTNAEKKNSEKANKVGFIFFMIALMGSSIYSYLVSSELNISFVILIAGLIVVSISEFSFNKFGNKK